jgi:hypothetical protein
MAQMNIEYNIELSDVEAFNRYYFDYTPHGKKLVSKYIRGMVCLSATFLLIGIFSWQFEQFISVICFAICIVPAFFAVFSKAQIRSRVVKAVREQYGSGTKYSYLGKHVTTFTPEYFADTGATGESKTNWNSVSDFGVTGEYLFMLLNPSTSAVIIPKRAFPDDVSFNQLVETARNLS